MNRREFASTAFAAFFLLSSGAAAEDDALALAFAGLSPAARKAVQQEMQIAGFYAGAIDGAYGSGTRAGLTQTAVFIAENSRGKVRPEIKTEAGAQVFLTALASGEMAKWLYGEGDEADEG